MNNFIKIFLTLVTLSLLTSGCLANLSQTSWGVLTEAREAIMLTVAPDESVAICTNGDTDLAGYIKDAIKMWAHAINRDNRINLVDCNSSARVKINAIPTSNPPGGTAAIYPTTGDLVYAPGRGNSFYIMLHEIGHAWGLCDQYEGVSNCDDTINGGNSNKNSNSVMGPSYSDKTQLTQDDIDGIKWLSEQDYIPTNASWKNISNSTNINGSTENSYSDLGGSLTVRKVGYVYNFTFEPTNSSFSPSSKLRLCFLSKDDCLNRPDAIWISGIIDLSKNIVFSSSYQGQSSNKPIFYLKINPGTTAYLLDVDSNGKLKQYTSFDLSEQQGTFYAKNINTPIDNNNSNTNKYNNKYNNNNNYNYYYGSDK